MSIEILKVVSGLRVLGKLIASLEDMNTRQHVQDRDEEFRLWLAEVARAAREVEARLGNLDARITAVLEDGEMQRVWRNLMFEAAREAIAARRRMLAYAAVGTVTAAEHLTVAQIARVERTMRELDPNDLQVLAGVVELALPRQRYQVLMNRPSSGDVLHAAGCVRVYTPPSYDTTYSADVTEVGRWVLLVGDPFLRAAAEPSVAAT